MVTPPGPSDDPPTEPPVPDGAAPGARDTARPFTTTQRNVLVGLAAVAAVLTVVVLAVALSGGDGSNGDGGDGEPVAVGPTTTTEGEFQPGTTSSVPGPVPTAPVTSEPSATTSSTSVQCRNSYDPACGTFRWDPDPGPNAPLRVEVDVIPSNPQPQQTVRFEVRVSDDDAEINRDCEFTVDYGDGSGEPRCRIEADCLPPYGPHTPPDRTPDFYQASFSHRYQTPGTYTAVFQFTSGESCDDPYASVGRLEVEVTVGPGIPSVPG